MMLALFSLDILVKDTSDGNIVAIENMLGGLSWKRLDDRKARSIAVYMGYNTKDKEIMTWRVRKLTDFRGVFKEHVYLKYWK